MTIYVSPSVVLNDGGFNPNSGAIAWDNLVTLTNVTSTTEEALNPVTNVSNVSTASYWRGTSTVADEYLTVTVDSPEQIDSICVARHNYGSSQIEVSVEVQATNGGAWTEVNSGVIPAANIPIMFRFSPQSVYAIRLRFRPSTATSPAPPEAGVVYVGKLLLLQRNLYVGHTPIVYGRNVKTLSPRSERGHFLGRTILYRQLRSSISLQNLTAGYYRSSLDPFFVRAQDNPFFISWRPQGYPNETGFCWMMGDPQMSNQLANGMVQATFEFGGISL